VIIEARYNGPPGSGNGGYSAGVFAEAAGLGTLGEVTLRLPPPLETPMSIRDGSVYSGADLIATTAEVDGPLPDPVPPVAYEEAEAASPSYLGFVHHPFPTCYVCGVDRADGLGVHPGRLDDGRLAAHFVAPSDASARTVWAALDCPGGWSVGQEDRPHVLGRIAVRVDAVPAPGDRCVVMGQFTGREGRKAWTLSSLYSPTGALLATARATWIAL